MIKYWNTLSKSESEKQLKMAIENNLKFNTSSLGELEIIRDELKATERKICNIARSPYLFDLQFGLALYEILNRHGFTTRQASDDAIWRFIAIRVIPDIVQWRYPSDKESKINEDRFYKKALRIYPKTLWWYIHLSYRHNLETTEQILSTRMSTDTILQLVERAGNGGYRINLYREIMYQYSQCPSSEVFRKVMKLNTVRVQAIEPELTEYGVVGYVEDLFKTILSKPI